MTPSVLHFVHVCSTFLHACKFDLKASGNWVRPLACEYTAVSPSSPATRNVSPGGTSVTQRQKFHTDDINQCLHNKSSSHGVPNLNLFDFMFLLVDYGKVL